MSAPAPAWADDSETPITLFAAIGFGAIAFGAWAWTVILFKKGPRALFGRDKIIVNAFENVVVYRNGQFERVMPPGAHWIRERNATLLRMDMRPEVLQIAQGRITADRMAVVLRYVARIQIKDPKATIEAARDCRQEIYADLQSMTKRLGQQRTLSDLFLHQDQFGAEAKALATQLMDRLGIDCLGVERLHTESSSELPTLEKDIGFRAH